MLHGYPLYSRAGNLYICAGLMEDGPGFIGCHRRPRAEARDSIPTIDSAKPSASCRVCASRADGAGAVAGG